MFYFVNCISLQKTFLVRVGGYFSIAAICFLIVGCGESADAIAIRQLEKKRRLTSPPIIKLQDPVPVNEWSGERNQLVAHGVYGLGGLHPSAAYAIDTGDGLILIDTGSDEKAVRLKECLTEVGLKVEDIKYVLLTHAHYDHVFGSNRVRETSNATVCVGAGDVDVLRNADEFALFSLFPRVEFSGTPIVVDRVLNDGDTIELGDTIVSVIACAGHTPGSLCYLAEKNEKRILFSGDVIASVRFGPATYPISISPKYRGDAISYLDTINDLLAMDVPDILLPGHPRQQTRAQSIAMSSEQWFEILKPAQQEIEMVVRRQRKDGRDFLDGFPKQIEDSLFYFGNLDGIAVYGVVAADKAFIVINAPGGVRLAPFLQDQCQVLDIEYREPDAILLTSLDEANRSGLESFSPSIAVMVPGGDSKVLNRSKPVDSMNIESLEQLVSPSIEVIAMSDGGQAANAYSFQMGSKRVLLTPSVPRNVNLDWVVRKSGVAKPSLIQPQASELGKLLHASIQDCENYERSLNVLEQLKPDIWLPSMPLTGQNANLYDESWERTIAANRNIVASSKKAAK